MRVDRPVGLRLVGALAVGGGEHNFADQPFHRPAIFHEPNGEVIQQFGVAWLGAEQAKVARRGDEATPEKHRPDTVYDDTCSKGVTRGNDRLGQFKPAAALRKRLGFALGKHAQKTARHNVTLGFSVAAEKHMQILRFFVAHHVNGA